MKPLFRKALFISFFTLFSLTIAFPAQAATFSQTLSLGSRGAEVFKLQVLLNSNPATVIAESGEGSPGHETGYFGVKTKTAVINFQKKYAPETLFPAGIWQPTGVVGSYTRTKLNSLSSSSQANSVVAFLPVAVQSIVPDKAGLSMATTSSVFSPLASLFPSQTRPILYYLSAYQVSHGQSLTIYGKGFLPTNNSIVFQNGLRVDNLLSTDGETVTTTIPNFVPNGSYNIAVENKSGTTFTASYGNFFTVTDSPVGPPVITHIEPASVLSANIQASITITGENFDAQNTIVSSLGVLTSVPSTDGKTMTISLSAFEYTGTLIKSVKSHVGLSIFLFVKNSHGVTLIPQKVILNF